MARPKWATASRQAHLVKLWVAYANQCLYGHRACPIPRHYLYTEPKVVKVAVPVKTPCRDREGNPIKADGKQVYLTVYATRTVTVPEPKTARLYELKSEQAIKDWVADDRTRREAEWQEEQKRMHSLGEPRFPLRGQFSAIAKDAFYGEQPQFYVVGLGISGLTFRPFAKVRLSSSFVNLFVDLGDSLKSLSKAKRRKAIRYGKQLPWEVEKEIHQLCSLAARHSRDH